MRIIRFVSVSLTLAAVVLSVSCTKGPKDDQNANALQANRVASNTAPFLQPTLKGDIERISLRISRARDHAKNSKWQEAVVDLESAKEDINSALSRKTRLREEFEALNSAIDLTISAIDRRDKDVDSQLAVLQTRIGAIKVSTP